MLWLNGVFSNQMWEIHKVIGQDDTVTAYCTLTANHNGDPMGDPSDRTPDPPTYVQILRFQDGKAIERWGVRDDATHMRQLRVMPPPGQPAATAK